MGGGQQQQQQQQDQHQHQQHQRVQEQQLPSHPGCLVALCLPQPTPSPACPLRGSGCVQSHARVDAVQVDLREEEAGVVGVVALRQVPLQHSLSQ